MDIVDRLVSYRDYIGFSNSQFADKAGIPRPTLSQFLNGRNKRLSDELASKLHQAFPDLNMLWLLFGEGDMVSGSNIEISEGKNCPNLGDFDLQQPDIETDNQRLSDQNSFDFSSSIQTKVQKNVTISSEEAQNATKKAESPTPCSIALNAEKRIQRIMVFYSDNSYETFVPSSDK